MFNPSALTSKLLNFSTEQPRISSHPFSPGKVKFPLDRRSGHALYAGRLATGDDSAAHGLERTFVASVLISPKRTRSNAHHRSSIPVNQTVCEAAGGYDGLLSLAHAWHKRVLEDAVVSHAFSHGYHPQHTERLAAYWAEALGGPALYSEKYGSETSVVRLHSGNGPHEKMDERAIACFDKALSDAGLAPNERLRRVLHDYFAWAATTTMARYHDSADDVPAGLQIPKWSWHGLVSASVADDK